MLELRDPEKTAATAYHVDPISGDDGGDGAVRPWKSWGRFADVARPGDRLLLKRGCTFSLPLPIVGGAAGRPTTYGAYGQGSKPLLMGNLHRLQRQEDWRQRSAGVWESTCDLPDVANVILGSSCGNMRSSVEDLKRPGEWHQHGSGAGPLYLRSDGNPASAWPSVEVVLAGNGITLAGPGQSHIRLEDLAFQKVGTHGVQLMDKTSDVQILRCDLSLIGGATYRCDGFSIRYGQRFVDRRVRFGNGIETWESVSDVLVEGCRVSEIFDGGICIQGFKGSTAERVCVRDNILWNCGYDSLDVAHGVLTRDLEFAHNTCAFAGEGWALQGEPKPRYSVNLPDHIGFHLNLESSYSWDAACAVQAHHNIFCAAAESRCFNYGPAELSQSVHVDHNGYFQPRAGDALVQLGKQRYLAADFAAYQRATGWDLHSVIADPLFVDAAAGDFSLSAASPCEGLGVRVRARAGDDASSRAHARADR